MSKEALKLALEGAANYIDALGGDSRKYRQALAEKPAQQDPVKWSSYEPDGTHHNKPAQQQSAERGEPVGMWMGDCIEWTENPYKFRKGQPLYTSPPAQRKPLTDEQIESINVRLAGNRDLARLFARAIEAAHGIKENT